MHTEKKLTYWDRIMMAITFAEAGETETAREYLGKQKQQHKRTEKQQDNRPELRV